jgi:hypothetical protein
VVDDAGRGVIDQREERRQQRRVGPARLVGRRQRRRDQLGIVEQAPRRRGELGQVLGFGVQRVIEGSRDGARLRRPPSVTRDT